METMREAYKIDGDKIIARIEVLNEKQLKTVKNYMALGFKLVPYVKPEKPAKAKDDKRYTAESVKAFLEAQAPEDIATYENMANAETGNYYKKDVPKYETTTDANGNERKKKIKGQYSHMEGDPILKGHVATLHWFKEKYGKDYEEWYKNNTEATE